MANEEWRPVVGYEGAYEVSDAGRVRSLTREVRGDRGFTRKHEGRVMSVYVGGEYPKVRLARDGVKRTKLVHVLVAEAFLGRKPDGMQVCHNNGDGFDNRIVNLRYDTPSANHLDTVAHGNHPMAQKTHCPKGHAYDGKTSRGGRCCLRCNAERARGYRAARKALASTA